MKDELLSSDAIAEIRHILRHGNSVELKCENGKLVVVEIQRKVKVKTSIIG